MSLAYPENLHAVEVTRVAGQIVFPGILSAVLAAIAAQSCFVVLVASLCFSLPRVML